MSLRVSLHPSRTLSLTLAATPLRPREIHLFVDTDASAQRPFLLSFVDPQADPTDDTSMDDPHLFLSREAVRQIAEHLDEDSRSPEFLTTEEDEDLLLVRSEDAFHIHAEEDMVSFAVPAGDIPLFREALRAVADPVLAANAGIRATFEIRFVSEVQIVVGLPATRERPWPVEISLSYDPLGCDCAELRIATEDAHPDGLLLAPETLEATVAHIDSDRPGPSELPKTYDDEELLFVRSSNGYHMHDIREERSLWLHDEDIASFREALRVVLAWNGRPRTGE